MPLGSRGALLAAHPVGWRAAAGRAPARGSAGLSSATVPGWRWRRVTPGKVPGCSCGTWGGFQLPVTPDFNNCFYSARHQAYKPGRVCNIKEGLLRGTRPKIWLIWLESHHLAKAARGPRPHPAWSRGWRGAGSRSRRDLEKKEMDHGVPAFRKVVLRTEDAAGVAVGFCGHCSRATWGVTAGAPTGSRETKPQRLLQTHLSWE